MMMISENATEIMIRKQNCIVDELARFLVIPSIVAIWAAYEAF